MLIKAQTVSNIFLKVIVTRVLMITFLFIHAANANDKINKNYQQLNIHGWRVFISNDVVQDKPLYSQITEQVNLDLKAIINTLPDWSLEYLRETPIFFEKQMPPPLGSNFFFNGSKRLSAKYNIQHTYGGVIAGSTLSYLAVKGIHPWQLLHELSHAYHQFTIRHSYMPIQQSYQNAMEKDLHRFGSEKSRKNFHEYFATLTEKYFGKSALFPHNRDQLAKHDPVGYCAIVKAWGIVGQQPSNPPLLCQK